MYERLGRMTGRSFEETVGLLTKGLKNAESSIRAETMAAFGKVCLGLGSAASSLHRDIYKSAKNALTDRSLPVRSAAADCLTSLAMNWAALYTTELDTLSQAIIRAFDGANSQARKSLAQLLGTLVAYTQQVRNTAADKLLQPVPARVEEPFSQVVMPRTIHPFPSCPRPARESRLSIRVVYYQCLFRHHRRRTQPYIRLSNSFESGKHEHY